MMWIFNNKQLTSFERALRFRKIFFWLFLVLVFFGTLYLRYTWIKAKSEISEQAIAVVASAEVSLQKNDLAKLEINPNDIDKPQYAYIKKCLQNLVEKNKGVRFAYIYTQKNDKVYFIADSEDPNSPDYSPPGEEFTEAGVEILQPLNDGQALITKPTVDRWGEWVSVLVPIKNEQTGKTWMVLGMDYPAWKWQYAMFYETIHMAVAFIILFFLLLTFFRSLIKNEILKEERNKLSVANKEIMKAQQIYRDMFDKSRAVKLLVDYNSGQIISANDAACEFYGYAPEQIIDMNITDINLLNSEDASKRRTLAVEQRQLHEEVFHRLASGEMRRVEVFASPLVMEEKVHLYLIINDITKRVLLERIVEQSHTNLKNFFNSINDLLFVLNTDAHIMYMNYTACERLNYSEEELVGKNVLTIYSAKRRKEAVVNLSNVLAGKEEFSSVPLLTKDEVEIPVETRVNMGIWNGMQALFCVIKDITAIEESEEKFSKAFHNKSVLMAIIGIEDGRYIDVNEAFLKTMGLQKEDVIGKTDADLDIFVDVDQNEAIRKSIGDDDENISDTEDIEIMLKTKDGALHTAIFTADLISICDKPCWLIIIKDITKRKEIEKLMQEKEAAEAASVLKGEFLANMSHEIRTPINGIVGFLQLLQQTELSEIQRDYVQEGINSSDGLLYLINNILDFSKIEAGKLELENIEFNIRQTIEGVLSAFIPITGKKRVLLHSFIKSDVPEIIVGDPARLRQILNNLFSNAMKFTLQGSVVVNTWLVEEKGTVAEIGFEVIDTGIGINKESCDKLFNPFTQADNSTTRKFGGTGLGLAISKELVTMMGGNIAVASVPGQGSRFFFTAKFEVVKEKSEETKDIGEKLAGLKVLIVDDNIKDAGITKSYLEEYGMLVTVAENGSNAISELTKRAEEDACAVVISAYKMPDMTGYDFARAVKSIASIKNTRLILFTSSAQKIDAMNDNGFDEYVSKPIKRDELIEVVLLALGFKNREVQEQAAESEIVELRSIPLIERGGIETPKILLVEDNEVNRKVVLALMENKGLTCDIATNGEEACERCMEKEYDIVFMDCQMPVLDGYGATKKIRQAEQGGRRTKIIAMTANAMEGDREKCLDAGMDDYISKPINFDTMFKMIRESTWYEMEQAVTLDFIDKGLKTFVEENELPVDIAKGIFDAFVNSMPELLKNIEEALAADDLSAVRRWAHQLKGSSGNLFVHEIYELAKNIEDCAKKEDKGECERLLQKTKSMFGI